MENTIKNQTVSIGLVAKLTGRSQQAVRICIQQGLLPGVCFKKKPSDRKYNYIILKKDVEEFFGIKIGEGDYDDKNKKMLNPAGQPK